MTKYVTHLNKGGKGMTLKSACGRSIFRMSCGSLSSDWDTFKNSSNKCEKCENSKQAEFYRRKDIESEAKEDFEPMSEEAQAEMMKSEKGLALK